MMQKSFLISSIRRCQVLLAATLLGISLITVKSVNANEIDPESDRILRSMSEYMGNLDKFSAEADIDMEFIDDNGQKIQLTSFGQLFFERPNKFYLNRKNDFADIEIVFDGKNVTISNTKKNNYFQFANPGNIDSALTNIGIETGLDLVASDLWYTNTYNVLKRDIKSSSYHGKTYVNGVECHHLAFREGEVDWQLWIQTGETPLPMKYVITTKWVTGAPQYSVRFRNWDINPQIAKEKFDLAIPSGATQLDALPVNEFGEVQFEDIR